MMLNSVLPILILMTGAAALGFLLARAVIIGRREEINVHRQQLMEEAQDLKTQNTELIQHVQSMQDERQLLEDKVARQKENIESLAQQIDQLEREKAFIIREFHQLKAESQPGENSQQAKWKKDKAHMEDLMEELKKTIVVLNNELNTIKNKTSVNPLDGEKGIDPLEKFK